MCGFSRFGQDIGAPKAPAYGIDCRMSRGNRERRGGVDVVGA